MRWVSMSSASFICKKSFLCFESSLFSNYSMASIWASSKALPTRTWRMGSTSRSKSKRSLSRSSTWICFTFPSGFGTKIGEGYSYYVVTMHVYLLGDQCSSQAPADLHPPCCHNRSVHLWILQLVDVFSLPHAFEFGTSIWMFLCCCCSSTCIICIRLWSSSLLFYYWNKHV